MSATTVDVDKEDRDTVCPRITWLFIPARAPPRKLSRSTEEPGPEKMSDALGKLRRAKLVESGASAASGSAAGFPGQASGRCFVSSYLL